MKNSLTLNAETSTEVGRFDFMNNGKGYSEGNEEEIKEIILNAEWETVEPGKMFPMGQGGFCQEAIEQFKIPKVSHVSLYNDFSGMGFYGIRGNYKSQVVDIFFIDEGSVGKTIVAHVKDK